MSKQQYLGEKQFSLISGFCLFQPHMERINWERCEVPKIVITLMLFLDTANAYQVNMSTVINVNMYIGLHIVFGLGPVCHMSHSAHILYM